MKTHFGLRSKVLAAMVLAFLLVAMVVSYLLFVQARSEHNHAFLARVTELNYVAQSIRSKANLYTRQRGDNEDPCGPVVLAWRDEFGHDLERLNQGISDLETDYVSGAMGDMFNDLLFYAQDEQFSQAVADLKRRAILFGNGYRSRLGTDLACPRVQWGVDYILEDERGLFSELANVAKLLVQESHLQKGFLDDLTFGALGIGLLGGVLGLFWFQFMVLRRIGKTVDGCRQVATGGFGYQIEVGPQRDELSSVVEAFNAMSTRTHLVLSVLDAMQDAGDRRESLKVIWEESQPYLGTEWLGLIEFNRDDQTVVRHSLPPIVYEPLRRAKIPRSQSGFESLLHTRHPLKIDDLVEFANLAANTSRDRFMRLMAERTDLRSMIALPLDAEGGWQGVLVFANTEEQHFNDEQVVLMGNLAHMIANGLAKGSEGSR